MDFLWLGPLYFLELGIFVLGGVFWRKYHRRPLERPQLALATLAATSLAMTSVLRSNIRYNDFGCGTLPAQFVLLLWTGWMLERLWRKRRRPAVVIVCLVIEFVTVAYDWAWMRISPVAMDIAHHNGFSGRHRWAMKRLYEQIAEATPATTIVRQNPNILIDPDHAFTANRQSVVLDRMNGSLFGTDGPLFRCTLKEIGAMFEAGASAEQIAETARQYGIGVLVVQDGNPGWSSHAWQDRSRFRLLAHCEFARAYQVIPGAAP